MLTEVLSASKPTARLAQRWAGGADGAGVLVGPHPGDPAPLSTAHGDGGAPADERPELVVVGSGNLGLVWFPRMPGKVRIEELNVRFPTLVAGLLAEPGIGFVVADSARGPLALGPQGVHVLREGVVEGVDPLAPFGRRAAADLVHAVGMDIAPDLYVHSTLDARTGEVHAFEELVGCHGGLGGWQNEAALVHPADWPLDPDLLDDSVEGEALLYGAEAVHRQLVRWLERCGVRADRAADRGRTRRRTARPGRRRVDERGGPLRRGGARGGGIGVACRPGSFDRVPHRLSLGCRLRSSAGCDGPGHSYFQVCEQDRRGVAVAGLGGA